MNILLTTVFDIPHIGGLSTHVATLKAGLEEKGHSVKIISFTDINKVTQLGYVRGPSFIFNHIIKGSGIVWTYKTRKKLLQNKIEEYLATNKVDIINAQESFSTLASITTGIPTVMTTHGYLTYEMISKGSVKEDTSSANYLKKMEILSYQSAGKVLTVDERIKNYIKEQADVNATAIKNFINVTDFVPNHEKRLEFRKKYNLSETDNILFIPRRLTRKNGVIQPVKSLPKVLEKLPNTRILYAGDGEERGSIEKLAKELGIEQNIILLGSIPHNTIKEFYSLSDVVLIPSIHSHGVEEATSISALEAMASGVPVIAGAIGGLKELIEHEIHGLLVKAEDPADLSSAIVRILENPNEGNNMAKNARKKIENEHSHLSAANLFLDAYENLIDERRKSNV